MGKETANSRRALRKARLDAKKAAKKVTASAPQSQASVSKAAPERAASTPATPREITAKVVDLSKLTDKVAISLSGPFNASTENPHWIVIANGDPLAKVALADQPEAANIRTMFATNEFATSFITTAKSVPIHQLLKSLRAQPYVASVKHSTAFEALSAKADETAKDKFRAKAAQYQDEFQSVLNLVTEAQTRNFLTDCPLKDALFVALKRAGVQDPVQVIEAAFQEAGPKHFQKMFAQANKWMSYEPQALADIQAEIMAMSPATVKAASAPSQPKTGRHLVPSSSSNVPVVATGSGSHPKQVDKTEKQAMSQTMNFRNRMHNRTLSPSR